MPMLRNMLVVLAVAVPAAAGAGDRSQIVAGPHLIAGADAGMTLDDLYVRAHNRASGGEERMGLGAGAAIGQPADRTQLAYRAGLTPEEGRAAGLDALVARKINRDSSADDQVTDRVFTPAAASPARRAQLAAGLGLIAGREISLDELYRLNINHAGSGDERQYAR
ncbi:hypothetical protein BH23PSE1_BH23PSE1_10370 [soil metagenome]